MTNKAWVQGVGSAFRTEGMYAMLLEKYPFPKLKIVHNSDMLMGPQSYTSRHLVLSNRMSELLR